jgi:undecaprenyl-diphosphatase
MIFNAINGLAKHNIILDKLMIAFSSYVPDIIGLVTMNEKMRGIAIDTFVITVFNLLLSFVIGVFWYVPRPFVNNKVNLLIPHAIDSSFPSDHAIGTMSIAVGINRWNKVYGRLLIVLSIIVGISRVFVGHHYPSDVIGGYAIVFVTSFLYNRFLKNIVQTIYFKIEKLTVKRIPVLKQFI